MQQAERILVVGYGFIGAAVARAAVKRGSRVRILTRSLPRALPDEVRAEGDLHIGDAADAETITTAVEGIGHVVYTAGDLRSGISTPNPAEALLSEVRPLLQTLEACRQRPLGFTYVSSAGTVYGRARALPIPEDHPTDPLVSYGVMKLACEKYALLEAQLHGLRACVVRCSNAYGEGQRADRPQGVVAVALDRIARGLPVTVYGDGSVIRDYIYVDDVARAILDLAAATPEPCVVNVGSGVGTSLTELLRLMREVTGRTVEMRRVSARGFDVPANVLDISRLRTLIDFRHTSLQEGIRRAWDQALRLEAVGRAPGA